MKTTRDAEPMALFGARLRELRQQNGLTQQAVADRLCLDRTTYNKYEAGRVSPDHQGLLTLASLFGVTVDQLLGRKTPLAMAQSQSDQLSEQEQFLLQIFRQLPPEEQDALVTQAQLKFHSRKKQTQPR